MTILNVADMHCPKCVERISNALTTVGIEFEINLEAQTVTVEDEKIELAIEELDDLGFDAVK